MRERRRAMALGLVVVFLLTASARTDAASVSGSVTDLGGGLFQYDLVVDNTGGLEALQGLLIVKANSQLGLDDTSVIAAPQDVGGDPDADWSFIAPSPAPGLNDLHYFSKIPAGDIPIGGTLGGFSFQGAVLRGFRVEGIGADNARQIPLGRVQGIPAPSAVLLLGSGVVGLLAYARIRRAH